MKKELYRDYAVEAFRFFAREGGYEAFKTRLLVELPQRKEPRTHSGVSKPVEALTVKWEKAMEENAGALQDLQAVERLLQHLQTLPLAKDMRFALEEVYFEQPCRPLAKGELLNRVRYVATQRYVSERTVFSWLQAMRREFSKIRGLRLN